MTHVTVRNGLTLAYVVALINSGLALMIEFGLDLSDHQQTAIVAFMNAAVLLAARVLHLPERGPDGTIVQVTHMPVLKTVVPAPVEPAVVVVEPPHEAP